MGISIKHDEYERLIRQLATARELSLTEAVGMAIRNELARDLSAARAADWAARVRWAQALVADAEVIDGRPYRELLYDADGLPR